MCPFELCPTHRWNDFLISERLKGEKNMPLRTDFMEKGSEVREAKYLSKVTQDVLGTSISKQG